MTGATHPSLNHLPPHLREVCMLLANGLVRLRSHNAEDIANNLGVHGESSLHTPANQSVCVAPKTRRPR